MESDWACLSEDLLVLILDGLCFVCLGVKYIAFEKYFFLYISVFIATKNDGQRKSFFSLTVKTYLIIRKWFMIFLNCFLDLNSSFLQVCLWESATAKHWSLLLTQIYR